jgi:hypothetical protein
VWILTGGAQWERLHELSMKKLIQDSADNLYFGLADAGIAMTYPIQAFVTPLAFDGRNVYVAVCSKEWHHKKDYLAISPNRIGIYEDALSSNIESDMFLIMEPEEVEGYYYSDMPIDAKDDRETDLGENLWCCDVVTGKVINAGKSMIRTERNYRFFYYHNSMVAVPPISN